MKYSYASCTECDVRSKKRTLDGGDISPQELRLSPLSIAGFARNTRTFIFFGKRQTVREN